MTQDDGTLRLMAAIALTVHELMHLQEKRLLSELTVTHCGVPIGTVQLVELTPLSPTIDPVLSTEILPTIDLWSSLRVKRFRPFEAFRSLTEPIVRGEEMARASRDRALSQPPSRQARAEANAAWDAIGESISALQSLASDMELHDETGILIPAMFCVDQHSVTVTLDEAAVGVLARLHLRPLSAEGESEPHV